MTDQEPCICPDLSLGFLDADNDAMFCNNCLRMIASYREIHIVPGLNDDDEYMGSLV